MSSLGFIREALRTCGLHAWRTPPRGADLFADLRNDLPSLQIRTVFDVGANVGQSAQMYLSKFPHATIHSFEPVPQTFAQLSRNLDGNSRVRLHNLALGSSIGEALMEPTEDSRTAFLSDHGTIRVAVETLDRISPPHIDFLKIDAEGQDLEILKGAERMLAEGRIDVVQVEVGMSPRHHLHVRFEDVKGFLEDHGMELFSLIDQMKNFIPGAPYLQRADAVFISRDLIRRHAEGDH